MKKYNQQMDDLLEKVAEKNGISKDKAAREIQAAIDAAWDNPDPLAREKQRALFPNGKPSIEEFIRVVAMRAKGKADYTNILMQ